MHTIYPDGKARKSDLLLRLDRAERLLQAHRDQQRPLQRKTANHLVDALGCLAKCLLDYTDRALDAAEKAAADTTPDLSGRPLPFTLADIDAILRSQRASLPADEGNPMHGWPISADA